MTTKDIRDRLVLILDTITPVSGTVWTVAPQVPRSIALYEGYVAIPYLRGASALVRQAAGILRDTQNWVVDVISPPKGTYLDALMEDAIYDYRDSVLDLLQSYNRLEHPTTRIGLVNTQELIGGAEQMFNPFTMGDGANSTIHVCWRLSLTITALRIKDC